MPEWLRKAPVRTFSLAICKVLIRGTRVYRLCRKLLRLRAASLGPRWQEASSRAVLPDPPFSGSTGTSTRGHPAFPLWQPRVTWRRGGARSHRGPRPGFSPSKRRGAGLQLRRWGSPPSCSRPPSAHLHPQPCPTARGTAGRRSPSSAAWRTDFRSAQRPPPAPGAWRRRRLAVSPARAATVSPRPSGPCPGRAACAGEGGEARSGDRDRDNPPGLHRSSPGEPWIPSAPGERSGRHSLGLGLRGGLQWGEETATMDATAGFLLKPYRPLLMTERDFEIRGMFWLQ